MQKPEMKTLTVRLPVELLEEFRKHCQLNSKKPSDAVRDFIRDYIKKSEMYENWRHAHKD